MGRTLFVKYLTSPGLKVNILHQHFGIGIKCMIMMIPIPVIVTLTGLKVNILHQYAIGVNISE